MLDFEWLRFCSLFSEDRVCRAVHCSRFQWNLSGNCQNMYEFWKKKIVFKMTIYKIKNIFLLTFKLNQFQDKKIHKTSIVHATVLTRVEYSGVLFWTFFVTQSKFWISLACPAAHGSVSKKKFPGKKSLISKLFDFKIKKPRSKWHFWRRALWETMFSIRSCHVIAWLMVVNLKVSRV